MSPTVIAPSPAAAPPVAPTPPAAAATPSAAELAAQTRAEAAEAKAAELERTAKFWYDKVNTGAPPKTPAVAAAEETDLLDLIATKGEKGLKAWIKDQGLVGRDEVETLVNEKASQLTGEAKLIEDYPDLAKKDSEFFKATAQAWGELKEEGVPERNRSRLAAERAELRGIRAGTIKTTAQKTADDTARIAEERRIRAAAGAGDHGGRGAAPEAHDEDLTPEQKAIAIRMIGGSGVTDEQAIEKYKARATKGIVMRAR